jgi:hypothetical protein
MTNSIHFILRSSHLTCSECKTPLCPRNVNLAPAASTDVDAHIDVRTLLLLTHAYNNSISMSTSERLMSRQILEIDQITTGASLSMGMSPTTKRIALVKSCVSAESRNRYLIGMFHHKELYQLSYV